MHADHIPPCLAGSPQGSVYIETVHRLSNLGAAFTWVGHGTSPEGFEAEWRGINVLTVDGDLINRGEIFEEADLDAALAPLCGIASAATTTGKRSKPHGRATSDIPRGTRVGRDGETC